MDNQLLLRENLSLEIEYILAKYVPWRSMEGNYLLAKLYESRHKNSKKRP